MKIDIEKFTFSSVAGPIFTKVTGSESCNIIYIARLPSSEVEYIMNYILLLECKYVILNGIIMIDHENYKRLLEHIKLNNL